MFLISTRKGSNIATQIDDQGVILVDSGRPDVSDEVLARIRKLTDRPIRAIINTTTITSPAVCPGASLGRHRDGRCL